jgi:hypothetical protein
MAEINKYGLKHQLNELLKADKKITIDFNCGNDEAHIVPFIDGKQLEYGPLYSDLEYLIYIDLNLPSNGEYMVTGSGYLTLEDENIYLFYDLQGFTYIWEEDEDEDVCYADDYEPQKDITEKMKDKYLLLSSEYDDPKQVKFYLDFEAPKPKEESIQSNFSTSDKAIWDGLAGQKSKPWWKFW